MSESEAAAPETHEAPVWAAGLVGLGLAGLGLIVILASRQLPMLPGLEFGPGFFPTIIGAGLVLFGLAIAAQDLRSWGRADGTLARPGGRELLAAAWAVAGLALHLVLLKPVGFVPLTIVYGTVLLLLLGRRWWTSLLFTTVLAILIDRAFVELLLVPLPAGILGGLVPRLF